MAIRTRLVPVEWLSDQIIVRMDIIVLEGLLMNTLPVVQIRKEVVHNFSQH